jgi:hypothetical protein
MFGCLTTRSSAHVVPVSIYIIYVNQLSGCDVLHEAYATLYCSEYDLCTHYECLQLDCDVFGVGGGVLLTKIIDSGSDYWITGVSVTSSLNHTVIKYRFGRTIAQVISSWLPTAAARVQSRVWSSGICGGQIGTGAGFFRVLPFPLSIFIPPNSPPS